MHAAVFGAAILDLVFCIRDAFNLHWSKVASSIGGSSLACRLVSLLGIYILIIFAKLAFSDSY
jgi:hypothetical protein